MKFFNTTRVAFSIIVILAFSISGCASFPGKELVQIDSKILDAAPKMESVDYSITWQFQGKESAIGVKVLEEVIKEVLEESPVFESQQPGKGNTPIHFDIVMNNHGSIGASFISGFISGFTFLIIPGYAKDNYTLAVDVIKNDTLIKSYQYDDHMSTWIGWIFVPAMPGRTPKETSKAVMKNMFRSFLFDLQKDGII